MARAKVFKHGGSQAVRLPKEFRFEVDEVDIHREGDSVVLKPARLTPKTAEEWVEFWARLDALGDPEDQIVRPPQPKFRNWKFDP